MNPPDPELISVVIPVQNEADSLPGLAAEIDAAARAFCIEVIIVDDGSTDDTWRAIQDIAARDARFRGLRFRRNFGKTAALAAGFASARGARIVTLDGDLQDDPAEMPRFLDALAGGLDLVSGWKKVRRDPWHKTLPSRAFNAMVSQITGVKLHDHNCGYKAFRSEVLREIQLYGERHRFLTVLAAARGFRVGEITVEHRPRRYGRSKYGLRRFTNGALDLLSVKFLTAFRGRPQHLLGLLGLVAIFLGAVGLASLFVVESYLLAMASFASLMAGLVLIIAGLLAELIVERSHEPLPSYSIRETTAGPASS